MSETTQKPIHMIVYGPEGSGKGTQAHRLAERLHIDHLVSGDLVRGVASSDKSQEGDLCREALTHGEYVPDEEMFALWKEKLTFDEVKNGWILDGFPRDMAQAFFLEERLREYNQKIDAVLYLDISDEESVRRLLARKREAYAGGGIHDTPEKIAERLKSFHKDVRHILDYFEHTGVLEKINGEDSIENIHNDIMIRLKKRGLV